MSALFVFFLLHDFRDVMKENARGYDLGHQEVIKTAEAAYIGYHLDGVKYVVAVAGDFVNHRDGNPTLFREIPPSSISIGYIYGRLRVVVRDLTILEKKNDKIESPLKGMTQLEYLRVSDHTKIRSFTRFYGWDSKEPADCKVTYGDNPAVEQDWIVVNEGWRYEVGNPIEFIKALLEGPTACKIEVDKDVFEFDLLPLRKKVVVVEINNED